MADEPLIASLRRAVEAAPADVPLRLHLAELLLGVDRADEAVPHLGVALGQEPASPRALDLMRRALAAPAAPASPAPPAAGSLPSPTSESQGQPGPAAPPAASPLTQSPAEPPSSTPAPDAASLADAIPGQTRVPGDVDDSFDWDAAARDLGEIAQPLFVGENGEQLTEPAFDLESSAVNLADVGGMEQVKQRL